MKKHSVIFETSLKRHMKQQLDDMHFVFLGLFGRLRFSQSIFHIPVA